MGMSVAEFERMLIGDFFLKLRYFFKIKDQDIQRQENLERLKVFHLLNIQLDKENKIKEPTDLWKYVWEMTEDEIEALVNKESENTIVLVDKKEAIEGVKRISKML